MNQQNDEIRVRMARSIAAYNLAISAAPPHTPEWMRLLNLGLEISQHARAMGFGVQLDMRLGEIVNDEKLEDMNGQKDEGAD